MARRDQDRQRVRVRLGVALVGLLVAATCAGCSSPAGKDAPAKQDVVRVPSQVTTITGAMKRVAKGGLVLVAPGVYHESVRVKVPDVTIRGTDRNSVIIDGGGTRPNGIVVSADGVTVENLTVRRSTFYGVLVTGMPGGGTGHTGYAKLDPKKNPPVQRFKVDHVTAVDNGLYGIYSFDAQHGVIEDSYASGSADSGIYVGQCRHCDVLVRGNVAERNAVGFENANASDSVYIVRNRWSNNRVGMTLISSYQEAFVPQHGNTVVGNLITGNTSSASPEQADGGFGIGVGISGGQDNVIRANRIAGNPLAGVILGNAEDIAATGNKLTDNTFGSNGVDIVDTSSNGTPSSGNCVAAASGISVRPDSLKAAVCPHGSARAAGVDPTSLPKVTVPPGMAYLDVPAPRAQPNLPNATTAPHPVLPKTIHHPDFSSITVPPVTYLTSNSGTR